MIKRIAAITFILICTTIAWAILGTTIFSRTYSFTDQLKHRVNSTWGTSQVQSPAVAIYTKIVPRTVETEVDGRKRLQKVENKVEVPLPLDSSRVDVGFSLEHRQKGLLWYSTYKVDFAGHYTFHNPSDTRQIVTFNLSYPSAQAVYDDLQLSINGKPAPVNNANTAASTTAAVDPGQTVTFDVGYRSQGLDNWTYKFDNGIAQVRDFVLTMHTNFKDIDFPDNTLSPTEKLRTGSGWDLTWRYKNLVSGFQIGMVMPQKLQPGPLAGQISYFAPVSLLFFFFLMFVITTIRGIELHPMNYFFLATAFFAFHLLLAYLVDHISIHLAFVICSGVSIFLVVTYLRLVVGMRFAAVEAAVAQLIYLVLFSYAFFFPGFTGLAVTIGAIITLFAVMQMTGRIKWTEKFAPRTTPATKPGNGESWVRG